MNRITTNLRVGGMTCGSCEQVLSRAIGRLYGVERVRPDFRQGSVEVVHDADRIPVETIVRTIRNAGYTAEDATGAASSGTGTKWLKVAGLLGLVLAASALLARVGAFGLVPEVTAGTGTAMLLFVGLLTSLHCVAMCGGISMATVSGTARRDAAGCDAAGCDTAAAPRPLRAALFYNGGRVVSYTAIGALAGAVGGVFSLSAFGQSLVTLLAGAFMILMGLRLLGWFPRIPNVRLPFPKGLARRIAGLRRGSPFLVGLLNGFMPCGPLQAMQLYALGTGSLLAGALSMFAFSLGTVPLMLGLGVLSGHLAGRRSAVLRTVGAVLVLLLGIQMAVRGIDAAGIRLPSFLPSVSASRGTTGGNVAVIEDGVQVVTSRLTNGLYQPITVQAGLPVRWTILAEPGDVTGCNRTLVIDAYGVTKDLEVGENVIEFTPDAVGSIRYACWMNMITSRIEVVSDLSDPAPSGGVLAGDRAGAYNQGGCCRR